MQKRTRISLLLLLLFIAGSGIKSQVDPHFTQYYVYPSWLNPALTGAFDGSYRVAGIHRNQWGNISSPFSTYGLAAEFTTNKNVNLGGSLLKQTAGNGGYSYTTAYGNFAYTGAKFGANDYKRLVFGLQAGIIQRRFDRSKMTFGDQWNPVFGFNPGNPSAEVLSRTSATSLDVGAGVLYFDAQPGKKSNFYAGFSASHLTQPDDYFGATNDAKFPVRYTVHAGLRIGVSEQFSITPNILYLNQGNAEEKMVGAYGQIKATPEVNLLLGFNYRFEDAVAPFLGFTYKNFMLGASYDVNTSDLGKMLNGTNSFEISLSIIGKRSAKTPVVEFVCPRL